MRDIYRAFVVILFVIIKNVYCAPSVTGNCPQSLAGASNLGRQIGLPNCPYQRIIISGTKTSNYGFDSITSAVLPLDYLVNGQVCTTVDFV